MIMNLSSFTRPFQIWRLRSILDVFFKRVQLKPAWLKATIEAIRWFESRLSLLDIWPCKQIRVWELAWKCVCHRSEICGLHFRHVLCTINMTSICMFSPYFIIYSDASLIFYIYLHTKNSIAMTGGRHGSCQVKPRDHFQAGNGTLATWKVRCQPLAWGALAPGQCIFWWNNESGFVLWWGSMWACRMAAECAKRMIIRGRKCA